MVDRFNRLLTIPAIFLYWPFFSGFRGEYSEICRRRVITLFLVMSIILTYLCGVSADRLPGSVPENQIFTIDTAVDSTGILEDSNAMHSIISSLNSIPSDMLKKNQTVTDMAFIGEILTNGGKISENKEFDYNSKSRGLNQYNIENERVLTFASTEGGHLTGEEQYILSIAGSQKIREEDIHCIFSTENRIIQPAFCNIISAESVLINVNTAKISSRGQLRGIGFSTVPAGLNYRIAITPDSVSGTGFAEGTFHTLFAGSIMEARDTNFSTLTNSKWNKTAAENTWKDTTEVTGGIKEFQKRLDYKSGFVF